MKTKSLKEIPADFFKETNLKNSGGREFAIENDIVYKPQKVLEMKVVDSGTKRKRVVLKEISSKVVFFGV